MAIMLDTAMDRAHMVMKTMEKKIEMTLLAMITKTMTKTMTDMAKETVGTVRRADMAMEMVDTETMDMAMEMVDTVTMMDMVMETVIMVMVKVDTNTETTDMAMETVDTNDYFNQTS